MCRKTAGGMVESFGIIRQKHIKTAPDFLRGFRYVIFKEEGDILGLNYHSVCIDLEVDFRGKNPDEAYYGLERAVNSFIGITLEHLKDAQTAYEALKTEKENRSETREIALASFNEVLGYFRTEFIKKIGSRYSNIHYVTKFLFMFHSLPSVRYSFTPKVTAYDDAEIESICVPKKSSPARANRSLLVAMVLSIKSLSANFWG